jgi:primosomal replication protein N
VLETAGQRDEKGWRRMVWVEMRVTSQGKAGYVDALL